MKQISRFSVLPLLVFAGQAFAANASFDCSKAKRADEVAICNNDELAAKDRNTTILFEELKRYDRGRAIAVSKEFLKKRHACKGDADCISTEQDRAVAAFVSAINDAAYKSFSSGQDAPKPKRESELVAVQPDNTNNPWGDAFSRRNYKLGMTLRQFKQFPFPDQKQHPGAYPVCSDDERSTQLDYAAARLYSDAYTKAGLILCKFFWRANLSAGIPSVFEAGLGFGDQQLDTSFYFIHDDTSVPRLFWIETKGPSDYYPIAHDLMAKAFGQSSTKTERLQNKLGASFDNQIDTWRNAESEMELSRYSDNLNQFQLEHHLLPLWEKFLKILDDQTTEAAKRL